MGIIVFRAIQHPKLTNKVEMTNPTVLLNDQGDSCVIFLSWLIMCKRMTISFFPLSIKVPNRFLEVAEITLREFFNAIVAGKDVDPSWKKAIYKVICKLDSEVPEIFKSPNCLQELLHE